MQILHETVIETHKTHLFINIRFLFDLLLSEYLNNKLLKLCELTFSSVHLLGLHGGLILRTSLQRMEIHSNISCYMQK